MALLDDSRGEDVNDDQDADDLDDGDFDSDGGDGGNDLPQRTPASDAHRSQQKATGPAAF